MIRFLDSDFKAILRGGGLGERVTFNLSGTIVETKGFFDRPTLIINPSDPTKAQRVSPILNLTVASSELPREPVKDDKVMIGDKHYRVFRTLSDGQGMLTVSMHEREQ
jgi:hypothetical protein